MGERNSAKAGDDQELEEWTAQAVAEIKSSWGKPLERALGVAPSGEDIWHIAQMAERYLLFHRANLVRPVWQKNCQRIDEAVDALRSALTDSAKSYQNLDLAWKQEGGADKALARIQQLAKKHAQGLGKRSKRNEPLRWVTDAVLHAYHNAGKTGLGINTHPQTGHFFGPVLDAVKKSLRLVGLPEQDFPGDSTIRVAAREVVKDK